MKKQEGEGIETYNSVTTREKGTGPDSAGQSGDTQGLSDVAEAGSESVEELVEEGQFFEADAIGGVEDAPDPDVAEVRTKQVPEADVPAEYLERDYVQAKCRIQVSGARPCRLPSRPLLDLGLLVP